MIARNYLIDERPDVIVNIVDAMNLERNLYLTSQLLDLGIPVIVGLNMMDVVKKDGRKINSEKLSYGLGVPVVPISVLKREGLGKITEMIIQATYKKLPTPLSCTYDDRLEAALHEIEEVF